MVGSFHRQFRFGPRPLAWTCNYVSADMILPSVLSIDASVYRSDLTGLALRPPAVLHLCDSCAEEANG